jgi:hypothetical protein
LLPASTSERRQVDQEIYDWATDVLFEVRKQRSEAKQPLKVPISRVHVTADAAFVGRVPAIEPDLRSALRVKSFETRVGEPRAIVVEGYEPLPTS